MMKRILFTGGGSAGHVVPNLAIMNELRYGYRVTYMGTGGIERELVGKAGYPFFRVDCPKLVRSFTLENLKIPHRLKRAKREALEILKKERPDIVFSKGGFASYPAVWAAHKLNIPVLTHESDLTAGLCTKLIAKKCRFVLTSFPETAAHFKNGKHVGSPVRREIFRSDRERARHKFGFVSQKPVLLVLGGGSGSKAINDAVREKLPALLSRFDVLHLCGKGNAIENPPIGYVQREFENDMGSAYACADLVLCRAGSNTLFEIICLKKNAVFVPLEKSSRGDQLDNALYFEKSGLCSLLHENELGALCDTLFAAEKNAAIKAALSDCTITSGTPAIVELIKDLLQDEGASG